MNAIIASGALAFVIALLPHREFKEEVSADPDSVSFLRLGILILPVFIIGFSEPQLALLSLILIAVASLNIPPSIKWLSNEGATTTLTFSAIAFGLLDGLFNGFKLEQVVLLCALAMIFHAAYGKDLDTESLLRSGWFWLGLLLGVRLLSIIAHAHAESISQTIPDAHDVWVMVLTGFLGGSTLVAFIRPAEKEAHAEEE